MTEVTKDSEYYPALTDYDGEDMHDAPGLLTSLHDYNSPYQNAYTGRPEIREECIQS